MPLVESLGSFAFCWLRHEFWLFSSLGNFSWLLKFSRIEDRDLLVLRDWLRRAFRANSSTLGEPRDLCLLCGLLNIFFIFCWLACMWIVCPRSSLFIAWYSWNCFTLREALTCDGLRWCILLFAAMFDTMAARRLAWSGVGHSPGSLSISSICCLLKKFYRSAISVMVQNSLRSTYYAMQLIMYSFFAILMLRRYSFICMAVFWICCSLDWKSVSSISAWILLRP